jgi:16S rRNA G966 N2-methylase RsmD
MNNSEIARLVRPISLEQALADKESLRHRFHHATLTALSNAGLKFIDHFTFAQRLAVRGKMDMNFFDFFANWKTLRERKYINNLLEFYDMDESPKTIYKIYNLAINNVHAFRPVVALQICDRFKPTHILDPCAGWGGRALAAHIYGAKYTGYDCNTDLTTAYEKMSEALAPNIHLNIGDSLLIDYIKLKKYDCVMTSPPYYDLERYAHNMWFKNDDDMDDQFYFPLFDTLRNHLQPGGWIVLSINQKLFDRVFNILYGPPHIIFPLVAHKRKSYIEYIYAWQK